MGAGQSDIRFGGPECQVDVLLLQFLSTWLQDACETRNPKERADVWFGGRWCTSNGD